MLLLKRHLVELVRAGKKRQTIRFWSRRLLRAGQISYTPGLGKMLITAVDSVPGLGSLTEADAVADGFATLAELLAEIHRIYGARLPQDRSLFRIQFQWPLPSDSALPVSPPPLPLRETKPALLKRRRKLQPHRKKIVDPRREKLRQFVVAQDPGKARRR